MPAAASDFLRDWQAVRDDASIQFAPLPEPEQAETPAWLERFWEWLGELFAPVGQALGGFAQALPWIVLALAITIVLWLVARNLPAARLSRAAGPEPDWAPDRGAALDLLAEAERLAAEGRFDDATHLLLQRSVEQIADLRPDLLRPSSTAREIAALPVLSEGARDAFGAIAARVERSLFALRPLGEPDWRAAREAYTRFALEPRAEAA